MITLKSENRENTRRLHEACFHSRQKRVCGDCGPAVKGNAYDRPMAKRLVRVMVEPPPPRYDDVFFAGVAWLDML
jgi:hypothetical protein